jgi:hypothetical protein
MKIKIILESILSQAIDKDEAKKLQKNLNLQKFLDKKEYKKNIDRLNTVRRSEGLKPIEDIRHIDKKSIEINKNTPYKIGDHVSYKHPGYFKINDIKPGVIIGFKNNKYLIRDDETKKEILTDYIHYYYNPGPFKKNTLVKARDLSTGRVEELVIKEDNGEKRVIAKFLDKEHKFSIPRLSIGVILERKDIYKF